MHNIKLNQQDPFEEKKKAFQKSKLAEKLSKKYTPTAYEDANKPLYNTAQIVGYICQLSSIITASTFVFAAVYAKISNLPFPYLIAGAVALVALVLIEYLQANQAPKFFEQILLRGFSGKVARRGLFLLALSGVSLFFSYSGGFDFAQTVAASAPAYTAPVNLSPTVIDIEEITKRYDGQIKNAQTVAAEYKVSRIWKGRLSIADANKHRKLLAIATAKESAMNEEIKAAKASNEKERANILTENNRRSQVAKMEHSEAVQVHESKISDNGGGLSSCAIIMQALFFLCVWYCEKYEYEVAVEMADDIDETPSDKDPSGGGGGKRKHLDTLTNEEIEMLLHKAQIGANDSFLNNSKPDAKMRVLKNDKLIQSYLSNDTKRETQTVYKDIEVEHFSEQKQAIQMVNLAAVKRNKSAWKSHLKKALETNKPESRIEDLKGKIDYWQGLENEIYQLSLEREKAII